MPSATMISSGFSVIATNFQWKFELRHLIAFIIQHILWIVSMEVRVYCRAVYKMGSLITGSRSYNSFWLELLEMEQVYNNMYSRRMSFSLWSFLFSVFSHSKLFSSWRNFSFFRFLDSIAAIRLRFQSFKWTELEKTLQPWWNSSFVFHLLIVILSGDYIRPWLQFLARLGWMVLEWVWQLFC